MKINKEDNALKQGKRRLSNPETIKQTEVKLTATSPVHLHFAPEIYHRISA